MSLLLETIKVANRKLVNIAYHNARLNVSRRTLLNANSEWDLSTIVQIPDYLSETTYKCRVEYGQDIDFVEFVPYKRRVIKKLYLIQSNEISYSHKYVQRDAFNHLKLQIGDPENNDILIIKNGLITDTSYSNIVFFDGKCWITPDTPLLEGTKRKFYLNHQIIHEKKIRQDNIKQFSHARLINAMIDLDESVDIPIENIISFS